jgi:hypothetical protein
MQSQNLTATSVVSLNGLLLGSQPWPLGTKHNKKKFISNQEHYKFSDEFHYSSIK